MTNLVCDNFCDPDLDAIDEAAAVDQDDAAVCDPFARVVYDVTLKMEQYIAAPYWPELDDKVNIEKKSGVNRARTEANRKKALDAYLDKIGMTDAEYDTLCKKAQRKWYRIDDDDEASPIIIPRHQLAGALVQAIKTAPAAVRGRYRADSFRHVVRVSDFVTEKVKADGVFDRFVLLENSNQRNRQRHDFIKDFTATGTLNVPLDTDEKELKSVVTWALTQCGVGSSRKMGYGRGVIEAFELAG